MTKKFKSYPIQRLPKILIAGGNKKFNFQSPITTEFTINSKSDLDLPTSFTFNSYCFVGVCYQIELNSQESSTFIKSLPHLSLCALADLWFEISPSLSSHTPPFLFICPAFQGGGGAVGLNRAFTVNCLHAFMRMNFLAPLFSTPA